MLQSCILIIGKIVIFVKDQLEASDVVVIVALVVRNLLSRLVVAAALWLIIFFEKNIGVLISLISHKQ